VQYEVFIDIETEEDLYDLRVTEQISARSFDALLLLYQTRVDVNRADRQQLYLLPNLDYADVDRILDFRERSGPVRSLGDLVSGGVLTRSRATSLRAFVVVRPLDSRRSDPAGFVRLLSRWTGRHDRLPPAAAVQARAQALRGLDVGVAATLTRNRLGGPRWDRDRGALGVTPERVRFEIPKLYVGWRDAAWNVVAGTYRIGFGQRLTFDVTDQIAPNGPFGDYELRQGNALVLRCRRAGGELQTSPCATGRVVRVTPDFAWTNRLAGIALGASRIPAGTGWVQVYAWGSYQPHRVGQSEIADAGKCNDPRRDTDPACAPPRVYVHGGDPSARLSAASQATLPAMTVEGLGGAHASYFWSTRTHLGLTGYGAAPRWLIRGATLDFQESARKPFGGPFGAIGLDAAIGFGVQDLFAEVAKSFDRQAGGGGGYAAVVRSVSTLDEAEIDVSLRILGPRYANPYARPVSAPDELDGLRARDETGLKVRATASLGRRLGLRVIGDVWRRLSTGVFRGLVFARLDLELSPAWRWAFWVEQRSGAGHRLLSATRLSYAPSSRVSFSGQLQHRWAWSASTDRGARDLAAIVHLTARPIDTLRVRARVRYDFEDVADNHHLPQTLWAHAELALTVRERDALRSRYDFRIYLDERESTHVRVPNPEHWLLLEYVLRY
jgi:hypothetical protein